MNTFLLVLVYQQVTNLSLSPVTKSIVTMSTSIVRMSASPLTTPNNGKSLLTYLYTSCIIIIIDHPIWSHSTEKIEYACLVVLLCFLLFYLYFLTGDQFIIGTIIATLILNVIVAVFLVTIFIIPKKKSGMRYTNIHIYTH